MPAGVGWGEYLRFAFAAFACTLAGAQTVHYIYKPLEGFDELVAEKEKALIELKKSRMDTQLKDSEK